MVVLRYMLLFFSLNDVLCSAAVLLFFPADQMYCYYVYLSKGTRTKVIILYPVHIATHYTEILGPGAL